MRRTVLLLLSGLFFACALPAPTIAEPRAVSRPPQHDAYDEYVAEAAQRFELPVAWIRGVMRAESNGDPRALSPKGAMGLMQIMPETWADVRVRHGLGTDPYDPHDNIIAGAAYIRLLLDRYGSPGWIAAYNAGPGRYEASLKGRPLPAETRAYVATVAPNLDATDAANPVLVAVADPQSWTRAPLFIAQPDHRPAIAPTSSERSLNDAPTTSDVRDVSAITPQSGGLFVARTTEGSVR